MKLKDLLKVDDCSNDYKITVIGNQCGYIYSDEFVNNNTDLFRNARVEIFVIRNDLRIDIHIYQDDIKKKKKKGVNK